MAYLRSFLPWIAVAILGSFIHLSAIAWIGLGVALAMLLVQLLTKGRWDAAIIELSAVVFFAILAAASTARPGSATLQHYYQPASSLWLALTAWGSLLIGKPFTMGIARTMVPEEYWDNPLFHKINRVISAVWAVAFTLTGVINAILEHLAPDVSIARTIVSVLGFVIPIKFTISYPETARARYAPN